MQTHRRRQRKSEPPYVVCYNRTGRLIKLPALGELEVLSADVPAAIWQNLSGFPGDLARIMVHQKAVFFGSWHLILPCPVRDWELRP